MKALSIRQPWAWAILHAGKDVENRSWSTPFRGEFLIHAAKGCGLSECAEALCTILDLYPATYDKWPGRDAVDRGGFVGKARVLDCRLNRADEPLSRWEEPGQFSFVLRDVQPIAFIPYRHARDARLGFFDVPRAIYPG